MPRRTSWSASSSATRSAPSVDDPETAEALCPTTHYIGTKRTCLDTNYYETYNLPHVRLVDLRKTPIDTVTETGIDTTAESLEFDAIVMATGFDAMTGAIVSVDITGRDGATLKDKWAGGPETYLGLMTVGFPNFFMITGPGSPSVLSNMAVSIEQHVEWISDCLADLRDGGFDTIEPTETAEAGWVKHNNEFADLTLMPSANSWYMGANVPGKPRVFLPYVGGVDNYRTICNEVVERDYLGFALAGDGASQVNDGVIRQLKPDVGMMIQMMATPRPAADRVAVAGGCAWLHGRRWRGEPARPGSRRGRRRGAERFDGRPPVPAVPAAHRRGPSDRGVLPRRRMGARQPRLRRRDVSRPLREVRRDHRVGQLPTRPGGSLPGSGRRRLRGHRVDRCPRRRTRWHPRPARRVRVERGGERRCGGRPVRSRCRWAGTRRSGAAHARDRQRHDPRFVRPQRRGLRAHGVADEVVLGQLRRRGRPHRSEGVADPRRRSVRPAPGADPHLRVRPVGRRGSRLRGGVERCRRRDPPHHV